MPSRRDISHDFNPQGPSDLSASFRYTLVWLFTALVAVFITLQMTSASFIDGQYLPVGHDAFYHGRRILDAVASGRLFQFDPMMHVPQGDWVAWPWTYDFVLARAVGLVMAATGSTNATAILMHLPPLLAAITVGVVLGIGAELRLPIAVSAVAALCFAVHAFTQYQFGVGALDHHGAEQLATLGALWLGLRWFNRPASALRAGLAGAWLGAVLGIHTAMFILQLPLLVALLLAWLRGEQMPLRVSLGFAAALLLATATILAPAVTFWQWRFVIYYLSWLHLYVAACTCLVVLFLARYPYSRAALLRLLLLAIGLAIPLLAALAFSRGFLSGDLATISDIDEIYSPLAIAAQEQGLRRINQLYTLLVWIAPLTLLTCIIMAVREQAAARRYFWLASAFGLALLLLQLRLGSLGVYFLYLPLLLLTHMAATRLPRTRIALWIFAGSALLVAYYPTFRHQLFNDHVPAMDQQYSTLRPLLPVLRDACARDPGVVLAEPGDGHLIRYFTECPVISNNFRLTPLDVAKVRESLDLISLPLAEVRARAPEVKYVVARLVAPNESPDPVLFLELLGPVPPEDPDLQTLVELKVNQPDGKQQKFLGAYRIQ
jgi:hypothetical protein